MSAYSKGRLSRNIPPITKYPTLFAGRNEHVCIVVTDRATKPETAEANADRLIACWNACEGIADPSCVLELLAALRECRDALARYVTPERWMPGDLSAVQNANAALAKAVRS